MLRTDAGVLGHECNSLELFCGMKAITDAMQRAGYEAVGYDVEDSADNC